MEHGRDAFLKAVHAEFEDLLRDLAHMEARFKAEFERLKIGQYVFLENTAFLQKERDCVELLMKEIDDMDPASYPGAKEVTDGALEIVKGQIRDMEYPPAIEALVRRKLAKASRYA